MRPLPHTPNVINYHGHCIAAIAQSKLRDSLKERIVRRLPSQITYDQYVGLVGVISSPQSEQSLMTNLNHLFGFGFQFGIFNAIDRWISKLDDFFS